MPAETLEELLIEDIRDLYDAERQLTKALPKLAKAAASQELRAAFTEHLEQTKGHVSRLELVFDKLGVKPKAKPCAAMKGLIEEGQEQTQEDAEGPMLDLMLIGAAQKVEHYEISGYGTVCAVADFLGNAEVSEILRATEEEERQTDEKLTALASTLMEQVGADEQEEDDDEDEEDLDDEDEDEDDDSQDDGDEEKVTPAKKAPPKKKSR